MPQPATPMRYCGTSPWRRGVHPSGSFDDACTTEALALISCGAPNVGFAQRPPSSYGRGPGRYKVPQWLRGFGSHFALLCAAIAGIVPLLAIGFLAFMSNETPASGSVVVPVISPAVASPPRMESSLSLGSIDAVQVLAGLEGLRLDLRRQEESFAEAQAASASRIGRLESISARETQMPSPPTLPAVSLVSDASPLLALGVDWAAYGAGADIDSDNTSPGLGRDVVGRTTKLLAMLLPRYRNHFGNVSHHPTVVLAADNGPPSKCLTLDSGGGFVAIKFVKPVFVKHVAIEALPPWAMLHAGATPRRFQVRAWQIGDGEAGAEPYSANLGDFEYRLDGPSIQVFSLGQGSTDSKVKAVQLRFTENWGEEFTSICRIRVLGPAL